MYTHCINRNTFTYKLLTKAFGETGAQTVLNDDENFTLDGEFSTTNIDEISVEQIMTIAKQKGKYDITGKNEEYRIKQENVTSPILKKYRPNVVTAEHIKIHFGLDIYDIQQEEKELSIDELTKYIEYQWKGTSMEKTALHILNKYINLHKEKTEVIQGLPPFKIVLAHAEKYEHAKDMQDHKYGGQWNWSKNKLVIYYDVLADGNINEFSATMLSIVTHELMHSLTSYSLDQGSPVFKKDITKLLNHTKDALHKSNLYTEKELNDIYGLTDEHEFIAEAFSNIEFQQLLAQIPYDTTSNRRISVWDMFVDLVRKILLNNFHINLSNSVLENTFTTVINKIEMDRINNTKELRFGGVITDDTGITDLSKFRYEIKVKKPISEESALSYFQKLGVVTKKKFEDKYWVRKTNEDQLLRHIGIINRENAKAIARYGVQVVNYTRTKNSAIVEINPEYIEKVNRGERTMFKLSEQGGIIRNLDHAQKWLIDRFGEDIGLNVFNDTIRIGDDFAHGWFDSAGIHLWNQSTMGTEYHEAFHAVFRLYNTDEQQKQLLEEAKQKYGNLSDIELEEHMADDFMMYMNTKNQVHLKGFAKIIDFFTNLFNYLSTYFTSKRTIRQIYSNIYSNQINKKFKRNLSTMGDTKVYKRVRGFTSQETDEVLNSTSQIFLEKRSKIEKNDAKSERLLLRDTQQWFFKNAFSSNGQPLSTNQFKILNELRSNLNKIKQTGTPEEITEARRKFNIYLYNNKIQPTASFGSTDEQRKKNNSIFLRIYDGWHSQIDNVDTENVIHMGWEELLIAKLRNYGLTAKQNIEENEDFDIELMEREEILEKIYNLSHLKEDLKNKLSSEVKILLRSIKTDEVNFLGFNKLVDFDNLYLDVALTLTRNNSAGYNTTTFNNMIRALELAGETKPYLKLVATRLKEVAQTDPNLASKFYVNFSTVYHRFLTVSQQWADNFVEKANLEGESTVDARREITFKLWESNRNNLSSKLLEIWNTNSIASENKPNLSAIYKENKDGELIVNQSKVLKAISLYNKLIDNKENDLSVKVKYLSDLLGLFGADIQASHIEQYLKVGKSYDRKRITGQNLLTKLIEGFSKNDIGLKKFLQVFGDITGTRELQIGTLNKSVTNIYTDYANFFKRFAAIESLFAIGDSGSFVGSDGKSVYPINMSTMLTDLFTDFKQGTINPEFYTDPSFVPTELTKDDHSEDHKSIFLRMFELESVRNVFEFYDLDSYKRKDEDVAKFDYGNINDNMSMIVRMNAFLNNGDSSVSMFVMPTFGDRERMGLISFPRLSSYAKEYGVNLNLNGVLTGYIHQDIRRINQAYNDILPIEKGGLPDNQLIENYHYKKSAENKRDGSGNAFKIWNLYGFSPATEIKYSNRNGATETITIDSFLKNFNKLSSITQNSIITSMVEKYNQHIEDMTDRQIQDMIKFGIIEGEFKDGVFVGKTYGKKITTNINTLDHLLNKDALRRYGSTIGNNVNDVIRAFAKDYIVNTMIVNNEITKFTRGSRAFAKNYEDFNKRFGATQTPGIALLQQGFLENHPDWGMPEFFNESVIFDLTNNTQEADAMVAGLKSVLPKNKEHLADNFGRIQNPDGSYTGKVNKTDAFGVITLKFGRSILQGQGAWTPQHEEAYKNYNNPESGVFVDNKGKFPPLMPIKAYYDGMVLQNNRMVPVMIKNSYQILIRDYTKDHPQVHQLLLKMEDVNNPIDAVNTESTRKLERHGLTDITSPNYELVVSKLPTKFFRIPQVIPNKHDDPLLGSQFRKDIISGILMNEDYTIDDNTFTGKQVFDSFNKVLSQMIKNSYDDLMTELNYDKVLQLEKEYNDADSNTKTEAKQQFKNAQLKFLKSLKKKILESVADRDLSENYTKALDIILDPQTDMYRFRVPLSFPAYGKKFNNILFSIFRNRVMQQHINGMSAVQIAELGGWGKQTEDSTNITEHLGFITGKDGKIVAAECAISWKLAEKFDIKPGQSLESIPEELRRIVGYRIPTQGKNSMLPMVIKYVLPQSYEHAILVPGDITKQMGSDYDIDKMFLIQPNLKVEKLNQYINDFIEKSGADLTIFWTKENKEFKQTYQSTQQVPENTEIDKDKQLIINAIEDFFSKTKTVVVDKIKPDWQLIKEGKTDTQSREQLENAIMDMSWGILMNKNHIADVIEPRDDNVLKNQAELFKVGNEELDFNYPGTEQELEMRNKAGGVGIGIYANFLSGHNISQFTSIKFPSINVVYNRRSYKLDTLGRVLDIEDNSISTNISRHLGVAVDNAKDPIMYYINDNTITSNVTGLLLSLGLPTEGATWLRMQPLIREFTEIVKLENASPFDYNRIKKELFSRYNIKETTTGVLPLVINIEKNKDGTYTDLTGDLNIQEQGRLLEEFIYFNDLGTKLVRINKVLMADRIGDMSSLAAIQSFEDLMDVVAEDMVDLNIEYPISDAFYTYGIQNAKKFFTDSGLFLNTLTYNTVYNLKDSVGREIIDSRIYDRLQQEILFYIYQLQNENKSIFTEEKFKQLFENKNNLVVRWNNLKNNAPDLLKNKFFTNFVQKYDKNSPYQILGFSTSLKMTADQKNILVDGLADMLYNPQYFTSDEATQKEIESFATDLISANFWQFGFSNQSTSITDIIPIDWFNNEFVQRISSTNEIDLQEYHSLDLFLDNFVANNSSMERFLLTLKINSQSGVTKKNNVVKVSNKVNRSPVDKSPYRVSSAIKYYKIFNKSTKEYDVYKFDHEDKDFSYYELLPKKGITYKFKEYLVYSDTTGNNVLEQSIIKRGPEVVLGEESGTNLDEIFNTPDTKKVTNIGDITEYMMSLNKQDRATMREALSGPATEVKCTNI